MGLPRALQEHKKGNTKEAIIHYKRALDHGDFSPQLFQNYGALLRESDEEDKAMEIYTQGLEHFPDHIGILGNRVNLIVKSNLTKACLELIKILQLSLNKNESEKVIEKTFVNLTNVLRELGALIWAKEIIRLSLDLLGDRSTLLGQLLLLVESEPLTEHIAPLIEKQILSCTPEEQADLYYSLAIHAANNSLIEKSLSLYEKSLTPLNKEDYLDKNSSNERQKKINEQSWNYGCRLLQLGNFVKGWSLYEYGLTVPADGPQRWQRGLAKPFSIQELPLWRGEPLTGKHLLVLEEQGIGDVMMFLTLIPKLQKEAQSITLMLNERLVPIYARSFGDSLQIITRKDLKSGRFSYNDFDLNTPLGSICQYRFTSFSDYAPKTPLLLPNEARRIKLRNKYLATNSQATKLIGISWQGGGKPSRRKQKSIDTSSLLSIISPRKGVRFVALQYGKIDKLVDKWSNSGHDIIHDPMINALKDMDYWIDQVAACDAVISVANTTIHGAGGLNIPTMCLLGQQPDWRWLADQKIERSYWYPSVQISHHSKKDAWSRAVQQTISWLDSGTPYPTCNSH